MRHTERLSSEAAVAAAKTDEWLLPAEAGTLEAEGMERTWRFSQVHTSCSISVTHSAWYAQAIHKVCALKSVIVSIQQFHSICDVNDWP